MDNRVGILLDHHVFKGVTARKTGYENIALYNKAAERLGLIPFYMTLQYTGKSSALGLIRQGRSYRLARKQIPKVTHNRSMVFSPLLKQKLKRLSSRSIVFNRTTRYSKYRIHRLLANHNRLKSFLPMTHKYTKQRLRESLKEKRSIYIKPDNGSIGNGIIRLSCRSDQQWNVQWSKKQITRCSAKRTMALVGKKVGGKAYLIQDEIRLARYAGRPYDLRVSVQRGDRGEWRVTGIMGKVAAPGRHVTNVAKGGKVMSCEKLFAASGFRVAAMKQAINRAALDMANYLGRKLTGLSDIGFDIGVDQRGRIYFIELNGRDQRIAFKKAGKKAAFYKSYETPLRYARYLLKR